MAQTSLSAGRSIATLLDRFTKLRDRLEEALAVAGRSLTQSDWIRALRDLQPWYVVTNMLAEEAEFMAGDQRDPIVPLCRFVDERKADIFSAIHRPSIFPFFEALTGDGVRSRLRRIRFYDRGRVFYPHFVFERFAEMVKSETIDIEGMMDLISSTMRPGHRWFIDNPDDDVIGAIPHSNDDHLKSHS